MAVRTYAWIARQQANVRYMDHEVQHDERPESLQFIAKNENLTEEKDQDVLFKRGEFWPSLVLVERSWEKEQDTLVFLRVYKRKVPLIVDLLVGTEMDLVVPLSEKYNIPIYQISTTKKGKRSNIQKLLDFDG